MGEREYGTLVECPHHPAILCLRWQEERALAETTIRIEQATAADAATVVALVGHLLAELGGFHAFDTAGATALCERLLATDRYTAVLARDEHGEALGVLTLRECPALYVAGNVGWIQELYVAPAARSRGVGRRSSVKNTSLSVSIATGVWFGLLRVGVGRSRVRAETLADADAYLEEMARQLTSG